MPLESHSYEQENPKQKENERAKEISQTRENIENLRARIIAETVGKNLSLSFHSREIPFDIKAFQNTLEKQIAQVFSNQKIPEVAKQKFQKDVMPKLESLWNVSIDDIHSLQTRRSVESFWVESLEIKKEFWGDQKKEQAYYLQKILNATASKYINEVSGSLTLAYSWAKESVWKAEFYSENVQELFSNLGNLDTKYGLDIKDIVVNLAKTEDISKADLGYKVSGILMQRYGRKFAQYREQLNHFREWWYKEIFMKFQWKEAELQWVKNTAESTGIIPTLKETAGMQLLESDFEHLDFGKLETNVKDMKMADFVIMITQLAQLAPLVWDVSGGLDGLYTAYSGMNVGWQKLQTLDRVLNSIFWVLWISVLWWTFAKLLKAKQFWKIIETLQKLGPSIVEKLTELQKTMSPEMRGKVAGLFMAITPFIPQAAHAQALEKKWIKVEQTIWEVKKWVSYTEAKWRTTEWKISEGTLANGRLSDKKVNILTIWNWELQVSPRQEAFYNALIKKFPEMKANTTEEVSKIIDWMEAMHDMHTEVPLWQHTFTQIKDKYKVGKEKWLNDDTIRFALENGFAGFIEGWHNWWHLWEVFSKIKWIKDGDLEIITNGFKELEEITKDIHSNNSKERLLKLINTKVGWNFINTLILEWSRAKWEIKITKEFTKVIDELINICKEAGINTDDDLKTIKEVFSIWDNADPSLLFERLSDWLKKMSWKIKIIETAKEELQVGKLSTIGIEFWRFPIDKIVSKEYIDALLDLPRISKISKLEDLTPDDIKKLELIKNTNSETLKKAIADMLSKWERVNVLDSVKGWDLTDVFSKLVKVVREEWWDIHWELDRLWTQPRTFISNLSQLSQEILSILKKKEIKASKVENSWTAKVAEVTRPIEKVAELKRVEAIPHLNMWKSYWEIIESLKNARDGISSEMMRNLEYLKNQPKWYLDFGSEWIFFFDGNIFRHTTWSKVGSEWISAEDLEKSGFTRIPLRNMPNSKQGATLYHNVIFWEALPN